MDFRWIDWNRDKARMHGVTTPEAEGVVERASSPYPKAQANDRMLVRGPTASGRLLQVVYLVDDDGTVFVIHARPLTEREKHQWRREQGHRGRR
jgi:uncharacterized DUF497 family protein